MELQHRIIIYPKDVALITGRNERYGQRLLLKIRLHLGKKLRQLVTVKEFCTYMGISEEEVNSFLR
ncbi:MAG: hypothetical protein IPL55_21405 [Saprospiraceae bacterium]|jgi:hypothetical protein|nr:hypothetical protein [Saprospiraceae bacterium]